VQELTPIKVVISTAVYKKNMTMPTTPVVLQDRTSHTVRVNDWVKSLVFSDTEPPKSHVTKFQFLTRNPSDDCMEYRNSVNAETTFALSLNVCDIFATFDLIKIRQVKQNVGVSKRFKNSYFCAKFYHLYMSHVAEDYNIRC